MSDIDPESLNKLKVTELRDELKSRGLDTKGTKPVLVKRLKKALNEERGETADGGDDSMVADESLETSHDESSQESSVLHNDSVQEEAKPDEPEPQKVEPEVQPEAEPEVETESEPVKEAPAPVEVAAAAAEEPMSTENGVANEEEMDAEAEKKLLGDEDEPAEEDLHTVDEAKGDDDKDEDKKGEKRKRSHDRHRDRSRSRDRKRSRSPRERRPRSPKKVIMEDDSWESVENVILDKYNSDLNLRISEGFLKGEPLTSDGFAMMWAGSRATYGVNKGKVAFEVKFVENLYLDHIGQEETNPHVGRVGWSVNSSSMQLGEEPLSYGYGGTAKASQDCKFEDYGEKYTAGDVITAYIDYEDEDTIFMSYAKNGEELGICFSIERSTLGDNALFPHILVKNTSFEVNFGAQEEPWFPLKEDFEFLDKIPAEDKIRGATPPAKKEECEVVMMVGLPGAGKTTWANKHSAENEDKRYNMLGTNNIIDKMKVMGLPRKRNYAGRWDVLIDLSTKCLNRMLELGSSKKRNYILDQTNVYASARRRKMQPFEGFQRKAVVIVPTDEEFKKRIENREKEEGKDVPERAVLEMKANFTLPEVGPLFENVELLEQEKDEIVKLVEKYNKEGKDALPPPEKKFRDGGHSRFSGGGGHVVISDRRDRRGGRDGFRDDRSRFDRRGGRGGYRDQSHGYRDDRYSRDNRGSDRRWGGGDSGRSYGRDSRSSGGDWRSKGGYGGSSGGGGGYRSGGSGGSWNSSSRSGGGSWNDRSSSGSSWSGRSGGSSGGGSWGGSKSSQSWGGSQQQQPAQQSWGGGQQQNWNQSGYGGWNYNQGQSASQSQGYNWGGQPQWGGQYNWSGYNQQGTAQTGSTATPAASTTSTQNYQSWGQYGTYPQQ